MTLDEAVEYFGSGWKMCQQLDIRPQNYTVWKRNNRIPLLQQLRIESLTQGTLMASRNHHHRTNRVDI
jgi:hypothetical protein